MAVRNSLAILILTLFVGLAPIPALAGGVGGATAEFLGADLTLTFSNDLVLSDQDILNLVLDASAAGITWEFAGFPIDPEGAISSVAGEGTSQVTVTFTDGAPTPGFNPGEEFVLFDVDADPGIPSLADLIGVAVTFTFDDDSTTHGVFQRDPEDPEARLTLMVVPEPETAVLFALGLFGLAKVGGRRPARAGSLT